MEYPKSLSLEVLESKHPEYIQMSGALQEIDYLISGGYKLKSVIGKFLPQRPGEEADLYETRLSKFTYLNILSTAINEQVDRLSNAPLSVAGLGESEAASKFWNKFREDTNLQGRKEKRLISNLLSETLKFKKVFVHVDKPSTNQEIRSKAQEEALGLDPYVVTYSPLQVINWDENAGKLNWIKVRQIVDDTSNPLEKPKKKAIWTFIDSIYVARYSATVELNAAGEISKVEGENTTKDTLITLTNGKTIAHGLGKIPILKFELPDELWVADQATHKALEHLRIDCSKYDLLSMSYFQRTYKPVQTPDSNNPNETYINDQDAPPQTGLQYVLKLEGFEWSEPHGHILAPMMSTLSQIEGQIRDLVSLGGVTASTPVLAQSGLSKQMDFAKAEMRLQNYGELICSFYQDVLQLVAKAKGFSEEEVKSISVTGLSNFDKNSLDSVLSRFDILSKIDLGLVKSQLPPTVFRAMYSQLSNQLVGNPSAEQQEDILKEIEELMKPIPVIEPNNLPIN